VIGRVGNTGSSSAPHLHFHITDGPDAVGSDGRPYVFSSFRYTGVVLNVDAIGEHFAQAKFRAAPPPPVRHKELTLNADVVAFP
jgi:murein DD-endopeptidase MepM/ murein hydrolase activator NlpD